MGNIILTGDRPTGKLHIGHYAGSLANRVRLQNEGNYDKMYVMIADLQAQTSNVGNEEKVINNITEVALDYLACGLDPKKVTIFLQSEVTELSELYFYYMNLVTLGRLHRNPTVKEEMLQKGYDKSVPMGFFTHPVSQAADITAFDANLVPVGEDQLPLIEQTQEIVKSFNYHYGETLVYPKAILPQNKYCLRIPGTDGKAKMSKSLGNCIYLSDEPEVIKTKVFSMYTDPNHIHVNDPGQVEGNTVFAYLDAFCTPEHLAKYAPNYASLDDLKAHYKRGGLGDIKIKSLLNNVLQEILEPIRTRRKELEKDKDAIYKMLFDGSDRARKVASATLARVKKAMGLNYRDYK